jgi:hypothetical protein
VAACEAEELYVVLALIMLKGIVQNLYTEIVFLLNQLVATLIFGSVISLDRFDSICRFLHLLKTPARTHMKDHKNCSKTML